MPTPVSSFPNLGPATEAAFARAGITSAEEVRAMGADEAYLALLRSGVQPHFIGYYVIVMGLQVVPGTIARARRRPRCAASFDLLKAQVTKKGRSELEAALDLLGVVERRR